jgi:hypothetical protein
MKPQPVRIDASMLKILAGSEAWIIPRPECQSHPVAVAFYVPAHLAGEVDEMFASLPATAPVLNGACQPTLHLVPDA